MHPDLTLEHHHDMFELKLMFYLLSKCVHLLHTARQTSNKLHHLQNNNHDITQHYNSTNYYCDFIDQFIDQDLIDETEDDDKCALKHVNTHVMFDINEAVTAVGFDMTCVPRPRSTLTLYWL